MDPKRQNQSLSRQSTGFAIKLGQRADKMVGPGMGLPRTFKLRTLLADIDGRSVKGDKIAKAALFVMDDVDFIMQLNQAFREEFETLSQATGATVEQGDSKVIGGYGPDRLAPSQLMFEGQTHSEVDRTIVGILCMKWILTDNYATFTSAQPPPVKLSKPDFDKLRKYFFKTFGDSTSAYMLIVSMIVNDLGKNDKLRDAVENKLNHPDPEIEVTEKFAADARARLRSANHDEIIYFAAKLGALELINEFDGERRQRLELGIQFGGMLNCGQLAQAENVPGSLDGIAELMKGDKQAFPMKYLEVVLDVAGAQGHVDSRCAKAWIAPVNTAYETARECVTDVIEAKLTPREAYDRILDNRSQLLISKGWHERLSTVNREDRALLRLITMARAANSRDAQKVTDVLKELPTTKQDPPLKDFLKRPIENIQEALISGLTVDGTSDGIAIIPYYAPGLLAEIIRVTKAEDESIQKRALAAMLRLMARAFVGTKSQPELVKGMVLECDLGFAQDTIRSREFLTRPEVLDNLERKEGIYSDDIDGLMKDFYGIRPLSRRGTAVSPSAA